MLATAAKGPTALATSLEPCAKAMAHAVNSIKTAKTLSTPSKTTSPLCFETFLTPLKKADPRREITIPKAIEFRNEYTWDNVSESCKKMILDFRNEILTSFETIPLFEDEATQWLGQMYSFSIPNHIHECGQIKTQLINEYNIEIPVFVWDERLYIRISLNGYNNEDDLHRLLTILPKIISIKSS